MKFELDILDVHQMVYSIPEIKKELQFVMVCCHIQLSENVFCASGFKWLTIEGNGSEECSLLLCDMIKFNV